MHRVIMESTELDGFAVTIVRKSIKNLYLRIKPPHGEIVLTAPKRMPIYKIQEFINLKSEWIKKQQQIIQQREHVTNTNFETGDLIEFQGEKYILNNIYNKGINRVVIDSENKTLNVFINKRGVLSLREKVICDFYKWTLDEQLLTLIPKWQAIIGVQIQDYRIRNMKSRWGSCKIDEKNICLNLQLAKAHPICLEYVLVHELVHLLERHHNKRFYGFMTQYMPQWQEYEKLLNLTFLK